VDACHVRFSSEAVGKTNPGLGRKPDDKQVVSLCREHHLEQHAGNEVAFWAKYGVNPLLLAWELYEYSHEPEILDYIIDRTWRDVQCRLLEMAEPYSRLSRDRQHKLNLGRLDPPPTYIQKLKL
jgi:hypothetical protein